MHVVHKYLSETVILKDKELSVKMFLTRKIISNGLCRTFSRSLYYIQGQSPETKVREYFYYIDHQGMVRANQLSINTILSCFQIEDICTFSSF